MAEEFTFECGNCGASLNVPVEYCGMQAECTECGSEFILPTLEEVQELLNAEQGSEYTAESDSFDEAELEETGTVKIDRSSIGMIPDVADQFKVNFETMESKPKMEAQKPAEPETSALAAPPKPKKKWWQFWK